MPFGSGRPLRDEAVNGKRMYRCDECGELHHDHYCAADCCAPRVSETWLCESCGSENFNQAEADACCPLEDPMSPEAYRHQVEQLEAAGQKRLIP